jgi:hypothetical protein
MLRYAAAAALAVAALAAPAEADVRSESMLRQFLAVIDGSPMWSARADLILSEGADTVAESIVLEREERPLVEVRIERLRLRDLGERSGGGFSAAEIELTDAAVVSTDAGFSTSFEYSVPSATVAGVSMPSFGGLEFDTRHIMSFVARIYSLAAEGEIGELVIPSVVGTVRSSGTSTPGESRVEYQNFRSTGLRDGVFESQGAGPILVSGTNPQGAFDFRIESVGVEDLDLAAFARIFDESQYRDGRGDGVWGPLASAIRYAGFAGSGPDGSSFQLDEFAIENIEGRQTERPFTDEWDRLMDPAMPEAAKSDLALEAATNLFSAWRVGTIRLAGFGVRAPAENTAFSLDAMTFTGLSSDGFESFVMTALSGSGPQASFSLDSFELAGFTFPDLEALMLFAALETDVDAKKHADTVRRAFAGLPRLAHFGMSGLSVGASADRMVRLASATIDMADWNDIYAESTDARIDDLVIPGVFLRQDPETAPMIDALGLDSLVIDLTASDRWSPDTGTDNFSFGVAVQDIFDAELSYVLSGVTIDWLVRMIAQAGKTEDSEAAVMAVMTELQLERATVKTTDRSLLDRAFGVAAEMQGLSVDGPAYRQQMRGALPFLLSTVIPAELARTITPPLQEFMDGGKTLVAEFTPDPPISVVEIIAAAQGDPTLLPDLLGLSMRTEAAE